MLKSAFLRSPQEPDIDTADAADAASLLRRLAERMTATKGEISLFGQRLAQALARSDWMLAQRTLLAFVESADEFAAQQARPDRPVRLAQCDTQTDWDGLAPRLLDGGVGALLPQADPTSAAARAALGHAHRALAAGNAAEIAARVDALIACCGDFGNAQTRRMDLVLEVLRQLLGNMAALAERESWVQGQIASAEALLAGSLAEETLAAAIANLKDVAARQAELKAGRDDARVASERMLDQLLSHFDSALDSTQQYGGRIEACASRLHGAMTAQELGALLDDVRAETESHGAETRRMRGRVVEAQDELLQAKRRISALESKLEELSELAREDPLTHSMNRRGMMEALCREMGRARRHASPLSIAMIDIDNFKQLNDRLGHSAGDGALVHLVTIIKATLRQMDVIARFGGEEFLLLLPNTGLDDAMRAVSRIQRELTKSIFMYEHQRVLVTFSAGAALAGPEDSEDSLIRRADAALYEAKKQGKNRVIAAACSPCDA